VGKRAFVLSRGFYFSGLSNQEKFKCFKYVKKWANEIGKRGIQHQNIELSTPETCSRKLERSRKKKRITSCEPFISYLLKRSGVVINSHKKKRSFHA